MTSIALIGAGLGGLVAARTLHHHGAQVTLFDKGSAPGGRLATRRSHSSPITYDHGAQYFTVKHPRFASLVAQLSQAGAVAPWPAQIVSFDVPRTPSPTSSPITRHVGTPRMHSMAEALGQGLELRAHTRIARIARHGSGYLLHDEQGPLDSFDAVVLNMPPTQAHALLQGLEVPALIDSCASHHMRPCWAVMLAHPEPLATFDGAFINIEDSPLSWIAKNSSKPQRPDSPPHAWVLHATHTWSARHLEDEPHEVAQTLYRALCDVLPEAPSAQPETMQAHRWRYAIPEHTDAPAGALLATSHPIALCGDWLAGGRVEGACLAGLDAAQKLIARLGLSPDESLIEAWQRDISEPLFA